MTCPQLLLLGSRTCAMPSLVGGRGSSRRWGSGQHHKMPTAWRCSFASPSLSSSNFQGVRVCAVQRPPGEGPRGVAQALAPDGCDQHPNPAQLSENH